MNTVVINAVFFYPCAAVKSEENVIDNGSQGPEEAEDVQRERQLGLQRENYLDAVFFSQLKASYFSILLFKTFFFN